MTSQSITTILPAIVALFKADVAIGALIGDNITEDPDLRFSNSIPADKMPHIQIQEGPSSSDRFITQKDRTTMIIRCRVTGNAATEPDTLRSIREAVKDALNGNPTVNDTCLSCLDMSADATEFWGQTIKHYDTFFELKYWRDVP